MLLRGQMKAAVENVPFIFRHEACMHLGSIAFLTQSSDIGSVSLSPNDGRL